MSFNKGEAVREAGAGGGGALPGELPCVRGEPMAGAQRGLEPGSRIAT